MRMQFSLIDHRLKMVLIELTIVLAISSVKSQFRHGGSVLCPKKGFCCQAHKQHYMLVILVALILYRTAAQMCDTSILSLNARACGLMSRGKYQEASKILLTGLQQVNESISADDTTTLSEQMEFSLQPFRVNTNGQELSSFATYSWAFLALEKCVGHEANGQAAINQLCAVLLYNSGLCYQARGMAEGTERTSFKVALAVYSHALSLLSSNAGGDAGPSSVLRLALLNNSGCILDYFCEFRDSQEYLRKLHHVLDAFYPVSPDAPCREDLLELRLNVTFASGLRSHAAAD